MEKKFKIVILERNSVGSDVSVSMFEKLGDVTVYETTAPDEIAKRVKDADIVLINKSPINESTIGAAPNIKLVGEFATGYDNVDINYCKSRGIAVTNVRGYSTSAVVQHTFALALYVTEHLKYYDEYVKSGEYEKSGFFTHYGQTFTELSGKTWGIIGMGNIGRGVAKVAESFGCNVIWSSASGTVRDEGYTYAELGELLSTADIISLHCPLNEKTKYLINKEKRNPDSPKSYATAASTPEGQKYGYIFDNCRFESDCPPESCYLGRPWRNFAHVLIRNSYLGPAINPLGFHNWNKKEAEETVRFQEYDNYGPGASDSKNNIKDMADTSGSTQRTRASFVKALSSSEISEFDKYDVVPFI